MLAEPLCGILTWIFGTIEVEWKAWQGVQAWMMVVCVYVFVFWWEGRGREVFVAWLLIIEELKQQILAIFRPNRNLDHLIRSHTARAVR